MSFSAPRRVCFDGNEGMIRPGLHPPLPAVRINKICCFGRAFLTRPEIVSTLSRPPCAAGGIWVNSIEDPEWALCDWQLLSAMQRTSSDRCKKTGVNSRSCMWANNARIGSITVCSTGSRLLTSNFIPCEADNSTSNLGIFLRDSGNAGSFLRDRPRDTQPSHLGKQRRSFQSQFGRCAAWSTDDPANLLKCVHNQSAIGVFQGHRRLESSGAMQTGDHEFCLLFVKWV